MKNLEKVIGDRECFEIVRKKLVGDKIEEFHLVDYEIIPIVQVNGYMGQYFKLITSIKLVKAPEQIRIDYFFTKTPPPTKSPQYDWNQEYGSFKKEVDLYNIVFPKVLRGLEKRSIPECFFGQGNDVIVLEDMAGRGYGMTEKYVPFDAEHCRMVLRTLARFHASSIAFEESAKKNLHEEFSQCMQETLWPISAEEDRSKRMFDAAVKGVVSMIDLADEPLNDHQRRRLKKHLLLASVDHRKKLLPSGKYRNVLCHGDLWANNILFKYDEDGKPAACCLIDFQLARYNPPAHDILCFLQFTTTRDLRKNHTEEFLTIYWDSMVESLKDAGLDVNVVFPWSEFIDSIKVLRAMCMTHGILNIPIMLLEPSAANKYFSEQPELLESVLYVDRTPLITEQFHRVPEYRTRMLDALVELSESIDNRITNSYY